MRPTRLAVFSSPRFQLLPRHPPLPTMPRLKTVLLITNSPLNLDSFSPHHTSSENSFLNCLTLIFHPFHILHSTMPGLKTPDLHNTG